jgi:hypothetical protein
MRRICAVGVLALLLFSSCSNGDGEVPAPGGPDTSLVRAPNGTTMGAPPLNAGTAAP